MAWGLTHDMHGLQKYGKMLGALAIPLAGMIPINNNTLTGYLFMLLVDFSPAFLFQFNKRRKIDGFTTVNWPIVLI